MDYEQYDQWSENVRMEREEYVQEKLTAEEFQWKTDKPRELTSYEAGKIKLADGPSMWQQLVARDFRFDSGRYFPREMARLIWTASILSGRYWLLMICGEKHKRDTRV